MLDAIAHPFDFALRAERHVVEHAGRAGAMHHEQVGETRDHEAQVVVVALAPPLLEAQAGASLRVEAQEGAADGIETGRQHQHVQVAHACRRAYPGWGDALDGILPQVNQGHVLAVVGLEVAIVEHRTLGGHVVVGHQLVGGGRVAHDFADLAAHEIGDHAVGLLVGQQVRVVVNDELQGAFLPEPLEQRLTFRRRVLGGGA